MKTNLKFMLPMLAIAATSVFYSCSDHEDSWYEQGLPDPSKDVIAFTSNGGEAISRASLAGSRAGFTADTKIVMRIKAEDLHTSGELPDRFTKTLAKAGTEKTDGHNGDNLLASGFTHSDITFLPANYRYWDDAFGRYSKLSIYAVCVPNKNTDAILADNILPDAGTPVHSSNNPNWKTESSEAKTLSWSVTASGQSTEQSGVNSLASKSSGEGSLEKEDLCYSNNIRNGATTAEKGVYRSEYTSTNQEPWSQKLVEGQMFWYGKDGKDITQSAETTGRFDQGHLIFKHALTKYTIKLTEGSGFDNTITTDFAFTNSDENVAILNVPTSGTFDFTSATWTSSSTTGVTNLPELSTETTNDGKTKTRVLQALSLPGLDLDESGKSTDNLIRFTIDHNQYYVTREQVKNAIATWASSAGKTGLGVALTKFTQGYHYEINITVGKKQIENITAELVGWEDVKTDNITPDNAYMTFTLEDRGGQSDIEKYELAKKDHFNIYRAEVTSNDIITTETGLVDFTWGTKYLESDKATKTWVDKDEDGNDITGRWKATNWFWPNNKTFYHFRIAGNATKTSMPTITNHTSDDYFTIKSGKIDGSTYYDYIWGAPFVAKSSGEKFFYSTTKGFDAKSKGDATTDGTTPEQSNHQIFHAIGATNSNINMMMFHMTSQIYVDVKTTTDNSQVKLHDSEAATGKQETKVELINVYNNGKVVMGNGLVEPTNSRTDYTEIEFKTWAAQTTTDGETKPAHSTFSYGLVPQTLKVAGDGGYTVGLRITTPDGNQYIINDISAIEATGDNAITTKHLANPYTGNIIDRWYPNYKYYYTVTLKKTGIVSITAQLVDWETVKGDIGEITLEGKD